LARLTQHFGWSSLDKPARLPAAVNSLSRSADNRPAHLKVFRIRTSKFERARRVKLPSCAGSGKKQAVCSKVGVPRLRASIAMSNYKNDVLYIRPPHLHQPYCLCAFMALARSLIPANASNLPPTMRLHALAPRHCGSWGWGRDCRPRRAPRFAHCSLCGQCVRPVCAARKIVSILVFFGTYRSPKRDAMSALNPQG
jgi:hypothetical protein